MEKNNKTCCFFGHRKVEDKEKLERKLFDVIEKLITCDNTDTFLFGSRSEFDSLCRKVVSELKEKYPHIKRIYVRAEYPYINDDYEKKLLRFCEETYFPERAVGAGKAVYIERNCEMIDRADVCVVYYKEGFLPPTKKGKRDISARETKSGTAKAYNYAVSKNRVILNMAETQSFD